MRKQPTYSPGYKPPVGYKTKPPTYSPGYKPPVGYKTKPPTHGPGYKPPVGYKTKTLCLVAYWWFITRTIG
jgi:hypothetical protein